MASDELPPFIPPHLVGAVTEGAMQFLRTHPILPCEDRPSHDEVLSLRSILIQENITAPDVIQALRPTSEQGDPNFAHAFISGTLPVEDWRDTAGILLAQLGLTEFPKG